jgi:peptide/nickel transport system substrate-binding protein
VAVHEPKKTAETDPTRRSSRGRDRLRPVHLQGDEWKPGEKVVYVKNAKYKPRAEPASGLAGGKVVKVDRVEWIWMPDAQTADRALRRRDRHDRDARPRPAAAAGQGQEHQAVHANPLGNQYTFRFNQLHKPFDNPRSACACGRLRQEDFLKATIGDPQYYKSARRCSSAARRWRQSGMADVLNGNAAKAKQLLPRRATTARRSC